MDDQVYKTKEISISFIKKKKIDDNPIYSLYFMKKVLFGDLLKLKKNFRNLVGTFENQRG